MIKSNNYIKKYRDVLILNKIHNYIRLQTLSQFLLTIPLFFLDKERGSCGSSADW